VCVIIFDKSIMEKSFAILAAVAACGFLDVSGASKEGRKAQDAVPGVEGTFHCRAHRRVVFGN